MNNNPKDSHSEWNGGMNLNHSGNRNKWKGELNNSNVNRNRWKGDMNLNHSGSLSKWRGEVNNNNNLPDSLKERIMVAVITTMEAAAAIAGADSKLV